MNRRLNSRAISRTMNEPAAGSTTRSPGLVTAPIKRAVYSVGFT